MLITNKLASKFLKVMAVASTVLLLNGCANTIKRVDVNQKIDLSGKWNDTDSSMVTKAMMDDVLSRPWLTQFNTANRRQPVVVIGKVRNLSHEHINTRTFINDMQRELTNSNTVQFVASGSDRKDIRIERALQAKYASVDTRTQRRQETGADFMLTGEINTIIDKEDRLFYIYKDKVTFYQVDLILTDLKTNRKIWLGQKKIKKVVGKPAIR